MTFDDSVRYQDSHEWARQEGDGFVIGVSDYAQDELGDVVFVELPEVGVTINKGETFGVVESVKAASDLYMPVTGEVLSVNSDLKDTPEKINEEPFGAGWIVKVKAADTSEYEALMDVEAYKSFTEGLDS